MPRYEDLSKDELIHRLHEAEAVARACSKDLEVLRQSEERFRLFLDHSPTVAWIKDAAGRFVYLSKTFEQRLGVRLDDWYGKTDAEVWPAATACDGVEAVEAAERLHPDLVLLDLGMPRLDGYGACRRIREQVWGRDLTVIALTGWGRDGDRRQTEEAGFDDHLVKPVAPAALLEIVARTCKA